METNIHIPSERSIVRVGGQTVSALSPSCDWRTFVAQYVAQKQGAVETRRTYARAISQFFLWAEKSDIPWSTLTRNDFLAFLDSISSVENSHKGATINLYIVAVKGFYEWIDGLTTEPHIPNIAKGVKSRRLGRHHEKLGLSPIQTTQLLNYFRQNVEKARQSTENHEAKVREALRDYALVNLFVRTGLRTIEVNRANLEHIGLKQGATKTERSLSIKGKGHIDYDDFVVLTDETYSPIREYLIYRGVSEASEPLFTCEGRGCHGRRLSTRRMQGIMKSGLRAIGLDGELDRLYSTHSLRHTAGKLILKAGGTIFDVQKLLRHSNPATSEIYVWDEQAEQRIDNAPEYMLDSIIKREFNNNTI